MFTFFVNMQKRGDGKVYADLHKTDGRIYFSAKEAQRVIQANQEIGLQHRHVVEMVAMTMEDYEEQSKEIAALRAELDALKRQEPVAEAQWAAGIQEGILEIVALSGYLPNPGAKLYAAPVPQAPSVPDEAMRDAERYRMVRRGQHWSVIDAIGDDLRADALDAAVDAMLSAAPQPERSTYHSQALAEIERLDRAERKNKEVTK